jgi:acyl carrier protein
MEIEQSIRDYINRDLAFESIEYANEASLMRLGILDSMNIMGLVSWADSSFGIVTEPDEITTENFDSVTGLAGYIRRKFNGSLCDRGAQL